MNPFEHALRQRHNGYDPEARAALPELKCPASPEAALDELIEEAYQLGLAEGHSKPDDVVYNEESKHHAEHLVDFNMEVFDTLFSKGHFEAINDLLESMATSMEVWPMQLLYSVTVCGSWAHNKLPAFANFVELAVKEYEKRGRRPSESMQRVLDLVRNT